MTTKILPGIAQLASRFDGLLLDAYGVFWGGNNFGLLPGSKGIMEELVAQGKIVGILSNSTQLASKEIHKLHSHDLIQGKHFHFLMTSGEIARHIFLHEKLPFPTSSHKFWLFGGTHPKFASHQAIFQETVYQETQDIHEADFIYISVPHLKGVDQIDPTVFHAEIEKLKMTNLPMVCANPDHFAHEGTPPQAVVRQGRIAMMYEDIGGKVYYIGKPHPKAYAMAMQQFHQYNIINPQAVLMIGDTPETDIREAHHFGMPAALVTQTGIMADRISRKGLTNALEELPVQDYPDYLIERLGT
ncbi:MAG: TIGR01459 family HAD-type hydrolase [Pseudanabaena sp. M57BS1SP1A06MG]|nr:TIGR01459 family HAD-type hydrolase [Pseudanabaena sp. M57BS1SP1A06MG]